METQKEKKQQLQQQKNAAHGLRDLFAVGCKTFIMPKKY
jgi:hypothetical protein